MKKIITFISSIIALFSLASCDWFMLDNLDGWDAQVEGKIVDIATGEPIQMEQGNTIQVRELYGAQYDHTNQLGKKGWDGNSTIGWAIKNNGTYVNKLTFAGDYTFMATGTNFTADEQSFSLKKGANTVDFKATPYLRIKNPRITMAGKVINATFDVEVAVAGTKVSRVEICVFPDRWVRHSQNNCASDPYSFVVNPTETSFALSVDPDRVVNNIKVNADEFQYDRIHYIRIAALGTNPSNSSNRYNYSPVYKLEKGQITEVTDW
ncbi:MAG: DUF3823 domain-containing protein [Bacteroidales bacterium]|nr:DUF3823 domain-containing protein [Bacteroidales bacterium]